MTAKHQQETDITKINSPKVFMPLVTLGTSKIHGKIFSCYYRLVKIKFKAPKNVNIAKFGTNPLIRNRIIGGFQNWDNLWQFIG